ncbi:hypothetical protein PM082_011859 [Marasmius tenuissimus]|nr:hypothetical protein PM082_011859 [Marasmius tenuissimus]
MSGIPLPSKKRPRKLMDEGFTLYKSPDRRTSHYLQHTYRFLLHLMADRCKEFSLRRAHDRSNHNDILGGAPPQDELFSPSPGVDHLVLLNSAQWKGNGIRLRVAFIDRYRRHNSEEVQERIVKHMNRWSEFCNVYFTLISDCPPSRDQIAAAEVRISFSGEVLGKRESGTWSGIGNEILGVANRKEPTMMLEGFDRISNTMNDEDFVCSILHETGHTLGFKHEHSRPEFVARRDRRKTYECYWRDERWDKATVDRNVLNPLWTNNPSPMYSVSEVSDPLSIMYYRDVQPTLKNGRKWKETGGKDLSDIDKEYAARWYPIPKSTTSVIAKDTNIIGIAAWENNLYLLMKNGGVQRQFEKDGKWGRYIIRKAPSGASARRVTTFKACDGQLYMIENGNIVSTWTGSFGDQYSTEWTTLVKPEAPSVEVQIDIRGKATYVHDLASREIKMCCRFVGGDYSKWRKLLERSHTVQISSTDTHLYRLNDMGEILQTPIDDGNRRVHWKQVDKLEFNDIDSITTNSRHLYMKRKNGEIWVYANKDDYWTKMYSERTSQAESSGNYSIEAYEDRLFRIQSSEERRGEGSGVWVNDNNTDHTAVHITGHGTHVGGEVGGWKPLQIKKDWSDFVYTAGYVYVFVKRTGEVTRYTGIC